MHKYKIANYYASHCSKCGASTEIVRHYTVEALHHIEALRRTEGRLFDPDNVTEEEWKQAKDRPHLVTITELA